MPRPFFVSTVQKKVEAVVRYRKCRILLLIFTGTSTAKMTEGSCPEVIRSDMHLQHVILP